MVADAKPVDQQLQESIQVVRSFCSDHERYDVDAVLQEVPGTELFAATDVETEKEFTVYWEEDACRVEYADGRDVIPDDDILYAVADAMMYCYEQGLTFQARWILPVPFSDVGKQSGNHCSLQ